MSHIQTQSCVEMRHCPDLTLPCSAPVSARLPHRQPASVLICVTLPTSGLPTCHNLSRYILGLNHVVPLQRPSKHWMSPGSSVRPNTANVKSNFFDPLDSPSCQIGFTGSSVCMCLPYPLFNWLGLHSNFSRRDQASVCYNMTPFLQLIYSSSGS